MIEQSRAQDKIPFSIIAANWLSRLVCYNGLFGALGIIRTAFPSSHTHRHFSLSTLFSTTTGFHALLLIEALLALMTSVALFEEIRRRRKRRFRPVVSEAVRKRGWRNFALLILVYLAIYASMINPAWMDGKALAVTLAMAVIGWRMTSRFSDQLPQPASLAVDPLSPDSDGSTSPSFPSAIENSKSTSDFSSPTGTVIAATSGKRTSGIKRTPGRLWLSEPNPHTLISERPRAQRMVGQCMALIMLAGALFLVGVLPQFRHPVPFFYLMPVLALFCCVILLSEASPQRLEIDLVGRTYRYSDDRPIMGGKTYGAIVLRWPFVTETRSGSLSEDFHGVGVRVLYGQVTTYYVNLIWNDPTCPQIKLGFSGDENEARILMEEAAQRLSLPALGRLLPK